MLNMCMYVYISKKANNKYAIKFGDEGRATKIVCLKIAFLHATQENDPNSRLLLLMVF